MAKKDRRKKLSKSGMSHVCSDCGASESVPVNASYSASRPRCSACGGPLQRKWVRGGHGKKTETIE